MRVASLLNSGADIETRGGRVCYSCANVMSTVALTDKMVQTS